MVQPEKPKGTQMWYLHNDHESTDSATKYRVVLNRDKLLEQTKYLPVIEATDFDNLSEFDDFAAANYKDNPVIMLTDQAYQKYVDRYAKPYEYKGEQ